MRVGGRQYPIEPPDFAVANGNYLTTRDSAARSNAANTCAGDDPHSAFPKNLATRNPQCTWSPMPVGLTDRIGAVKELLITLVLPNT